MGELPRVENLAQLNMTGETESRLPHAPTAKPRCNAFTAAICATVLGFGCGAHNMWNVKTRVEATPLSAANHPPHDGKVFVSQSDLTVALSAVPIAQIDVGTVTRRPPKMALVLLADKARELGANAVFKVRVWQKASGFSSEAPQSSGIAVRIGDTNNLVGFNGYWY